MDARGRVVLASKFRNHASSISATSYTLLRRADDVGFCAAVNHIDLCSSSGGLTNCEKAGSGAVSVAVSRGNKGQTNASRARARILVCAIIVVELNCSSSS